MKTIYVVMHTFLIKSEVITLDNPYIVDVTNKIEILTDNDIVLPPIDNMTVNNNLTNVILVKLDVEKINHNKFKILDFEILKSHTKDAA